MISDIRLAVDSLLGAVKEHQKRERPEGCHSTKPAERAGAGALPKPDYVYQELAKAFPQNVVIFQEAPSSSMFFFRHAHLNEPNSYFETASGGLGFAMPASVGAALSTQRPIVCILGEGSAQYSIQSLWSAAEYGAAVTFVILNNGEYAILKSFANLMGQSGIPGLDFSHVNFKGLAEGYGLGYTEIRDPEKIFQTVSEAITSRKANLVNIPIDPFVPALLGRSQ
jgi:benzoylformate decarboxylase